MADVGVRGIGETIEEGVMRGEPRHKRGSIKISTKELSKVMWNHIRGGGGGL